MKSLQNEIKFEKSSLESSSARDIEAPKIDQVKMSHQSLENLSDKN